MGCPTYGRKFTKYVLMAWVTEYDMLWTSPTGSGSIYLQRDGGSYIMPLTLAGDSLEIRNVIPSWDDPIARLNCSFTIINDLSDFYELMPLITISNGQIKVVVTHDTIDISPVILFEGYLNCEAVSQKMLDWSPINLTASGYLSKLDNSYPSSIDTVDFNSLINVIGDCLTMTGSADLIYVSCSLYENNSAIVGNQTLFNRNAVWVEIFWKNNIDRMSTLEILSAILKSFDCYLFWKEQIWYIEHYADLGGNKEYIIYDPASDYGYTDTGGVSLEYPTAFQIHSDPNFKQVGDTQNISINPGLKRLDIKLDLQQYYNLFHPDLADASQTNTAEPLLSSRRAWWVYDSGASIEWMYRGEPFRNISNAIYRSGYDVTSGSDQMNGMSIRFGLTALYDTELVIKFKFGVYSTARFWLYPSDEITITFNWYLALYDSVVADRDYIWWDPVAEDWTIVDDGDPEVNFNTLEISASELDADLHTYEGTLTIPIGEIYPGTSSAAENHLDLIFRMGTENAEHSLETDKPADACYYGDFSAVINENTRTNLLRGEVVTDFLDTKVLNYTLFDAGWNYRNSIYRYVNQYRYDLAEDWTYDGVTLDVLENWILKSKFRLSRIARQKITMDVHSSTETMLPLLQTWEDNKQSDMEFVQLSTIYRPQKDIQTIELYEYDNTEVINLV